MIQETFAEIGEEYMPTAQEEIERREIFYVTATLENNRIGCGDDRPEDPNGAAETDVLLQMFGGPAFIANGHTVVEEVLNPGSSVGQTFADKLAKTVEDLDSDEVDVEALVHSDALTEGDHIFRADHQTGAIGCAYINLRQQISQLTYEQGEDIIKTIEERDPSLIANDEDRQMARDIIAANGRIASNHEYFGEGGRKTALSAIDAGAAVIVLEGAHDPRAIGMVNHQVNSTISTTEALEAGLPAYNHDQWVVDEINNRLRNKYPYPERLQQIASAIDVEGVLRALGVQIKGQRQAALVQA